MSQRDGKEAQRVALFEDAVTHLDPVPKLWLKRAGCIVYFNCTSIDPNGPYLHLGLECVGHDRKVDAVEIQIPHAFVKAIVSAHDLKAIGFADES